MRCLGRAYYRWEGCERKNRCVFIFQSASLAATLTCSHSSHAHTYFLIFNLILRVEYWNRVGRVRCRRKFALFKEELQETSCRWVEREWIIWCHILWFPVIRQMERQILWFSQLLWTDLIPSANPFKYPRFLVHSVFLCHPWFSLFHVAVPWHAKAMLLSARPYSSLALW